MIFKEDWNNQDYFDVTAYNKIIKELYNICKKRNLNNAIDFVKKGNIEVGDDLSGQTIYLNIDSETSYEWLTTGLAVPIISTSKNSIDEGRVYDAGIHRGIAINFDIDLGIYQDFLYLNYEDVEIETNLKEYKLSDDFGIVDSINTDSSFYKLIKIYKLKEKKKGDFLYVSDLQNIENALEEICNMYYIEFAKKEWNNFNVISYKDVNRWCNALNKINTVQDYEDFTSSQYSSLVTNTYREILYKKEE